MSDEQHHKDDILLWIGSAILFGVACLAVAVWVLVRGMVA